MFRLNRKQEFQNLLNMKEKYSRNMTVCFWFHCASLLRYAVHAIDVDVVHILGQLPNPREGD